MNVTSSTLQSYLVRLLLFNGDVLDGCLWRWGLAFQTAPLLEGAVRGPVVVQLGILETLQRLYDTTSGGGCV